MKNDNTLKSETENWDLSEILGNEGFDAEIARIKSRVIEFAKYRKVLNNDTDPQLMLEIIKSYEHINLDCARLNAYYELRFAQDTQEQEAIAKLGHITQILAQVSSEMLFFSIWFMHLEDKIATRLMDSNYTAEYRYFLQEIRKARPYTKSEEIERILQIKDISGMNGYSQIYEIMTNSFMFDWYGKLLSKEEIVSYYTSDSPEYRQRAYETILGRYKDNSAVLGEIYKNIVTDWYNDGVKIRGYKSSIGICNLSQDVTDRAVEALLETVRKNASLFHEYFSLKYKLNKKSGQTYPYSRFHVYAPYKTKESYYSYNYSKSLVLDTYNKFDKRFYKNAKSIFDTRHVDSHPRANKRGGAFCYTIGKSLKPYILLNHTDTLRDVFTIAHEFGHGIHTIFSSQKQPDIYVHAALPICETASVFGEMLFAERMLKDSIDIDEKKHILVQLLDNQFATIIRQAYFVIFEEYAHEAMQNGTTKEEIDSKYYDLLKEQFGDMEIPSIFKYEWNYIPHIHETPFYCYSYAWGNLLVLALYDMYRKDGDEFVEKYIGLLSSGSSASPADLLRPFGIDVESEGFWQRGFDIIKNEIEDLKRLG